MKTYRSKPFQAIQLVEDMSNWREVCIFMNPEDTYDDDVETPEFLDVWGEGGWTEVYPTNWIVRNVCGGLEVYCDTKFKMWFEEVEE